MRMYVLQRLGLEKGKPNCGQQKDVSLVESKEFGGGFYCYCLKGSQQ